MATYRRVELKGLVLCYGGGYLMRTVNQLEKGLNKLGYEVVKLPGLNLGWKELGYRPTVFNYTNSIFSKGKAIVPQMGVRMLDEAAHKVSRNLFYLDQFYNTCAGP